MFFHCLQGAAEHDQLLLDVAGGGGSPRLHDRDALWRDCFLQRLSSFTIFALVSALDIITTGLIPASPRDRREIVKPPLPFKFFPKVQ